MLLEPVGDLPRARRALSSARSANRRTVVAMAAPVLLLDVDGVLNVARPGWAAPPRHATASTNGQTYPLCWAPDLLDRLRDWHLDGRAELRWATTWCRDADQLERLWGLPPLARALADDDLGSFLRILFGKLNAALAVVEEEHRPLVWVDDDAIPAFGPYRDRLDNAPAGALLLTPRPTRGITREEADLIESFLDDRHDCDAGPLTR